MECQSELVEAIGINALPYRAVTRWIGKFQQGCDEQRSGPPASVRTDLERAVIEQHNCPAEIWTQPRCDEGVITS
ncbi:hypothetical protein TNCV_445901 [Trichonephila clavipes]|nr:hypothetical protein TNCV_445901 [Trichonephila clavipes]